MTNKILQERFEEVKNDTCSLLRLKGDCLMTKVSLDFFLRVKRKRLFEAYKEYKENVKEEKKDIDEIIKNIDLMIEFNTEANKF
jgi:hypothetical protein